MKRRDFFKNTALAGLGIGIIPSLIACNETQKTAKNIIFLVSDGMSIGTLSMADLLMQQQFGKSSIWMQSYREKKVVRALMETSSASSFITDSAAGGSSWGCGHRVNNGSINVGTNKEEYTPILKKFKEMGKKVGCVTTVPVTHATPSSFCVNQNSRNDQGEIAEKYLNSGFDLFLGGGQKYFKADKRKDGKDLLAAFSSKGFQVALTKRELSNFNSESPVLGVFDNDGIPYSIDLGADKTLFENIPTLSEMTSFGIQHLNTGSEGFVMQVEAGKVDWAAHGNDAAALLYDQIEFDKAVEVAMKFAEQDGNTLVVITTDHGNANPGLVYGKEANKNFERIQKFKQSYEWVFDKINFESSVGNIREITEAAFSFALSVEEAEQIKSHYGTLTQEELYNPKKLPYKKLSEILFNYTSIGWAAVNHTADLVELAMYGPGSNLLDPFVKNFEVHNLLLKAAGAKESYLEVY